MSEKKYPIGEVRVYFVFKHPKTGEEMSSKLYTPLELLDTDLSIINERTCVCDCQPVGETNVVECNCDDYYQDFQFHSYHVELAQPPAEQPVISQDAHEKEVMMQAFNNVRQIFEGREWIMEGRGCYPYNDDRYKEEVRYMYNEFNEIVDDTWNNIESKSGDYRKAIIEEYLNGLAPEQPGREVDDWISVDDRPLKRQEGDFWELTEDGEKEFIAAVPYHDRKSDDPGRIRWWIRHCYIDNEGYLYVKRDDPMDEDVAGWAVSDITHWKPLPEPPAEWSGEKEVKP